MSNLRQVGIGMQVYLQANQGWVPRYQETSATGGRRWYTVLMDSRALGSGQVLFCPNRVPAPIVAPATTELESSLADGTISYGLNMSLSYNFITDVWEPTRLSQIRRPTETILAVDAYRTPAEPWGSFAAHPYNRSAGAIAVGRHPKNGCNVLWADGHVTTVRTSPGLLYSVVGLTSYLHSNSYWNKK